MNDDPEDDAEQIRFINPTTGERTLNYVITAVLLIGGAFAVNTNILIAAFALTRSERVLRVLHKVRIVWDVALVLLVPSVSLSFLSLT